MPAPLESLIGDEHIVVRVRVPFLMHRGRRLGRLGQFKGLVTLTHAEALFLEARGDVKFLDGATLFRLRDLARDATP